MKSLLEGVCVNKTLNSLHINYAKIGKEGGEFVKKVLQIHPLKELSLQGNPLTNAGIVNIVEALKVNTTLRELDLFNTSFEGDDDCVSALVQALQHNNHLQIDLKGNPMSDNVIEILSQFGERVSLL